MPESRTEDQETLSVVPSTPPSPPAVKAEPLVPPLPSVPQETKSVDILELLRSKTHFLNKKGTSLEIINVKTGVIDYTLKNNPDGTFSDLPMVHQRDTNGVPVLVQANPTGEVAVYNTAFSPITLEIICQKILEGHNITDICKEPGMPDYNVICRWRREYPEVASALEMARKDRAEALRDRIMKKAEDTYARSEGRKEETVALGVLLDATKWTTGVDNEKYNPKTKVEATVSTPTVIQVVTGIVRDR